MKQIIRTGDKLNKLTAIKFSHKNKSGQQYWFFKCECGNEKIIKVSRAKNGNTKSCGCLKEKGNSFKHGLIKMRAYSSWAAMKQRCLNPNSKNYKYWGGRGITVCLKWMKFENFLKDMGERPQNKSLDRIDNNGNYCRSNCRYAIQKEQMNNTRRNTHKS